MRWNRQSDTPERRAVHGLGGIGSGLLLVAWSAWFSWEGIRSGSWPSAEARVTEARGGAGGRNPAVWFTYEFEVNGKTYRGSRYDTSSGAVSRSVIEKHPIGSTLRAHYDPADPARAVVVPGVRGEHLGIFVAGIAAILFGFWRLRGSSSELMGERPTSGKLYRPRKPEEAGGA